MTYTEGAAVVQTTIGADLAVEELRYAAPTMAVAIHPSWIKLPAGFLLNGYAGQTQPPSAVSTRLMAQIDNRSVDGLQLPATVRFSDGSVDLRFSFSDCLVTRRPP